MKLYISSDIEGTTGITAWDETDWGNPRNAYFLEQMSREVAAACEGANNAGCDEIWVKDAHDSGRNIIPDRLPEDVRLLRGWIGDTYSMMGGINRLEGGFDAIAMTGYHSWAGGEGNPLSHTMTTSLSYVKINGVLAPEFLISSYIAGYYNIPVVFLSGDRALCDFAADFIPAIKTVAVNEGFGKAVLSINPSLAVKKIREGMYDALSGDISKCRVEMPDTFTMDVGYKNHADAYSHLAYPGVEKLSATEIRFKTNDWLDVMRFMSYNDI